jgi:hypothetical protein
MNSILNFIFAGLQSSNVMHEPPLDFLILMLFSL